MKLVKCIIFAFLFLLQYNLNAQDLNVHLMIGKSKQNVINTYGNPVHQDNNDPSMMCMFYQTKSNRMIFVANSSGVFQAEAYATYSSEQVARKDFNNFVAVSQKNGFSVDSISVNDYQVFKPGIKASVQIAENKISKNYEINVKGNKTED